jgi:hypothetical protein
VDLSKEDAEKGYSLEPKASEVQLPTDGEAIFDVQNRMYQNPPLNCGSEILTIQNMQKSNR